MILDSAVERARVGRPEVGWQDARTQQARACKDEQRSQHAAGRLSRMRSILTRRVSVFVRAKFNAPMALQAETSVQLRNLG